MFANIRQHWDNELACNALYSKLVLSQETAAQAIP